MAYTPTDWVDGVTPVNATNLDHMETGIDDAHTLIAALEASAVTRYRKSTTKTVVSSVTATDLLNGEITIAAGKLTSTGIIKVSAWGDWLQNSGGASSPPRLRLALGGTTLIDTGALAAIVTNNATRGSWMIEAIIAATNATNVQSISWRHWLSTNATTFQTAGATFITAFTTGQGMHQLVAARGNTSNTDGALVQSTGFATGAKDMTASQLLEILVINGANHASYETKLFGALAEVL